MQKQIKEMRDKMFNTRLESTMSLDEEDRQKKLEEDKKLKKEMAKLMAKELNGGEENDKYK